MLSNAMIALSLGLVAGLKPGPLGVFVIHQTMSRGLRHGFMASLAPIITDGPIILLAFLMSQRFRDIDWFIAFIALVGAAYLIFVAYRIFTAQVNLDTHTGINTESSLTGAIKLNLLNPAPYLFWFTVGVGFMTSGTTLEAITFVVILSISLCGTKFTVAAAMRGLGSRFSAELYSKILKLLAIPLLIFSLQLMYTGIQLILAKI